MCCSGVFVMDMYWMQICTIINKDKEEKIMKKRVMSVLLGAVMTATLLTGCGGQETNSSLPSDEKKSEVSTPAPAEGDLVSDENYKILQDNYAILTDVYNTVANAYNNGEIPENAELKTALDQAYDVIEEMGQLEQKDIPADKAEDLNDLIGNLIKVLQDVPTTAAAGDIVSDEDFATLQGNYNILTELYNAVATRYNSGDIQKDAELETALNQAHDIIEQLGNVKQEDLTQDKAVELNNAMFELINSLVAVADVG